MTPNAKGLILVFDWPAQSSDLNSIKNSSNDVKCTIALQKYINLNCSETYTIKSM